MPMLYSLLSVTEDWRFLPSYPQHYVAQKLGVGEVISIDGKIDDAAWGAVPWTEQPFVDITHHNDSALNTVPDMFQTRAKIRWDQNYVYIAAQLNEPFVFGKVTGHNIDVPYHDGDFEVFIDVSGTTQYYKEYEMNVLNATYDVNWGVPDGAGLQCDKDGTKPYLPVCVNTSFPGYAGNWSMISNIPGLSGGGLTTATAYDHDSFGKYIQPSASIPSWSLEIAFPIRAHANHGGLLDASGRDYSQFDPNHGNAGPGRPRYWFLDFARAEHPRRYTLSTENIITYCPFNCSQSLEEAAPELSNPNKTECGIVKAAWPTLLGVDPWSCYWEWVWQDLGGQAYMHRPTSWGMVQFSDNGDQTICRNIEFPGRHVALQIFNANLRYKHMHSTYASNANLLLDPTVCYLPSCSLKDLNFALVTSNIFTISIVVIPNATHLTSECTSRPCFTASIKVIVPSTSYIYITKINENQLITVDHVTGTHTAPCL